LEDRIGLSELLYLLIFISDGFLQFLRFEFVAHQLQFEVVFVALEGQSFVHFGTGILCLLSVFLLQFVIPLFVNLELKRTHTRTANHTQSRLLVDPADLQQTVWLLHPHSRRINSHILTSTVVLVFVNTEGKVVLRLRLSLIHFIFIARPDDVDFRLILTPQRRPLFGRLFPDDSGSRNLIDSHFAQGLTVQTFANWNNDTLSFRFDEFAFDEFEDATHIFCSFLRHQLHDDFDVLLVALVFKTDLLIEQEFVGRSRRNFSGDTLPAMLQVNLTGKLDFEGETKHSKRVRVYFHLFFY
jgi:hypothetical protein